MKDIIKISDSNSEVFDKKQIALAIRNSSLNDILSCSLKEDRIIAACDMCSLKLICDGIDKLSCEYISKTSSIVKKYNFS